jgi:HKD family nuclease
MSECLQRINLHQRLKKHSFQHCLIATFTFDVRFFENYALESLNALQENANISVVMDAQAYQELVEEAANPEDFPRLINQRYFLHPVRVPRGVFHPKVFLFASSSRGLLIIGSANFTEEGLGGAAEMVAVFDFERDKKMQALPLFQTALNFFETTESRWPSEELQSSIAELRRDAEWINAEESSSTPSRGMPELLTNFERPLWEQLMERVPSVPGRLSVLSRYFDATPTLPARLLAAQPGLKLSIYSDRGGNTLTEAWVESDDFRQRTMDIRLCNYKDEDKDQSLHAKAYAFDCGKYGLFAAGSANFTLPALMGTADKGNVEVLLCYPPVAAAEFSPSDWFDPDETARLLRSSKELGSGLENPEDAVGQGEKWPCPIVRAAIEGDALLITVVGDEPPARFACCIAQANTRELILPLRRLPEGTWAATLDERLLKRLGHSPALVRVGTSGPGGWESLSAGTFVIHLKDLRTGQLLKQSRLMREAREDARKFTSVLLALSQEKDTQRLIDFLNEMNIPFDLSVRLFRFRKRSRDPEPAGGMRTLDAGGIRAFIDLHDAVMDFAARHRRQLDKHIEYGTAKGIPNFLHILSSIAALLLNQIERVIAVMKGANPVVMDAREWSDIRQRLDAYYRLLAELLRITAVDYVKLIRSWKVKDTLWHDVAADLEDVRNLDSRCRQNREELVQLERDRLEIETISGRKKSPGFFKSVLADAGWNEFSRQLTGWTSCLPPSVYTSEGRTEIRAS